MRYRIKRKDIVWAFCVVLALCYLAGLVYVRTPATYYVDGVKIVVYATRVCLYSADDDSNRNELMRVSYDTAIEMYPEIKGE